MSLVNSPLSDDFTADFMEANVEWPDPASTIGGRAFADQVMAETPNIAPSSIWDWNKTRFRGWSSPEPQSMWSEDPGPMLAYDDVEDDASLPSSTEADDLCKKLHPSTKPQSSPLHLELTGGVTQSCVFSSPFLENDDDKYSSRHDDSSAQLGHTSTQVLPEKVPTISLADLGDLGYEIGCGGPKGSSVYKVCHEDFGAQPLALKIYREHVLEDEMDFIQTMYDAEHEASGSPNRRQRLAQGLQHLVIPVAVVVDDEGKNCGLLMPLYQYSLGCLLEKQVNVGPMSQSSLSLPVVPDSDERTLLSGQRFCPTVATEIITAISYQLLQAIALVNSGLSHAPDGLGFSHNDIHLGNVVANPDGTVALCDFELVTPIVDRRHSKKRLPPLCRQSPNGLFASDADTWAFALIVINLLTGVDPLFSSERIQDDFGDGPLLAPYNGCDGPTLDWEANIGPHVEELLLLMNPSGERLFHAEPLLALCGRCLVNRPGATASTAMELLTDPVFHLYHTGERSAEAVVKEWLEAAYV